MNCPECGVWTEVISTRGTRRRRECGNGHRFTTEEVIAKLKRPPIPPETRQAISAAQGSIKSVARQFGVSERTVKRIKNDKTKMQMP